MATAVNSMVKLSVFNRILLVSEPSTDFIH